MILELLADSAAHLQSLPFYARVPIVSVNEKDVGNTVDQFLNKLGIGIVLGTPTLGKPKADVGEIYFDAIDVRATVFESVAINRSDVTNPWAPTVAEMLATRAGGLHQYKPQNISESFYCTQGPRIIPYQEADRSGALTGRHILVYDVAFRTQGGLLVTTPISKIATPVVTVTAGMASIACSTPYVAVFYTLDGTFPAPIDSTNTPRVPYAAPFDVTSGQTLKVRAWFPGYLASDVVTQNY
jgi:hypothetical protein